MYDKKDTLALFISDSINFHNQNRYIHLQHPHTCQNRFGKVGFINSEDQVVIPFEFDYIQDCYDSLFLTAKKKCWGVIDGKGNVVVPFEYSRISPTTNKQFIVYKNGMSGVVNLKNEFLIPLDSISIYNFGILYFVRRHNSNIMGLMNYKGERILSEKYSLLGGGIPFNSGEEGIEEIDSKSTIIIRDVTTWLSGMYRADGIKVVPIIYNYVFHRPENFSILIGKRSESDTNKLQYAAVDINGKFIVDCHKASKADMIIEYSSTGNKNPEGMI